MVCSRHQNFWIEHFDPYCAHLCGPYLKCKMVSWHQPFLVKHSVSKANERWVISPYLEHILKQVQWSCCSKVGALCGIERNGTTICGAGGRGGMSPSQSNYDHTHMISTKQQLWMFTFPSPKAIWKLSNSSSPYNRKQVGQRRFLLAEHAKSSLEASG